VFLVGVEGWAHIGEMRYKKSANGGKRTWFIGGVLALVSGIVFEVISVSLALVGSRGPAHTLERSEGRLGIVSRRGAKVP
jgi:hypothetical protein